MNRDLRKSKVGIIVLTKLKLNLVVTVNMGNITFQLTKSLIGNKALKVMVKFKI